MSPWKNTSKYPKIARRKRPEDAMKSPKLCTLSILRLCRRPVWTGLFVQWPPFCMFRNDGTVPTPQTNLFCSEKLIEPHFSKTCQTHFFLNAARWVFVQKLIRLGRGEIAKFCHLNYPKLRSFCTNNPVHTVRKCCIKGFLVGCHTNGVFFTICMTTRSSRRGWRTLYNEKSP